jgi:hypothetical protein
MEPTVVGVTSAVSELRVAKRWLVVTVVRDIRRPFFCIIDRDTTIRKIVVFVANETNKYFLNINKLIVVVACYY